MRRSLSTAVLGAFLLSSSIATSTQVIGNGGTNGTTFTYGNTNVSSLASGYQLGLNGFGSTFGVNLPAGTDWTSATHVLLQIKNIGTSPEMVFIGLDSGSGNNASWLWSDTVVPAGQVITVAMPLQAQTGMGIQSWPSLPDTSLTQLISNGSAVKNNMRRIMIENLDSQAAISLQVLQVSSASLSENTSAFVDQYGQQSIDFPGKVTSDAPLQAQATQDALLSGNYPFSSDLYGGVAGTGSGTPTGKWSVAKQNGRWYILDPAGNRFFSAGIVGAGWSSYSFTLDRLGFFAAGALPSQSGPFAEHYRTFPNPATGQPTLGYNFYSSNLQRKFGANWTQAASQNIEQRMRTWGFNTLGPLSSLVGQNGLVSTPVIPVEGNYARVPTLDGGALPDVYDPTWSVAVQNTLQTEVSQVQGNLLSMGLFIDNELPWAQSSATATGRYLLPFSVLSAAPSQPAKRRFLNNLAFQYRTIGRLNTAWGTTFSSWSALQNTRSFNPGNLNATLARDLNLFTSQFATQYFSTIRTKLRSLNYTGLYLGSRFLYYTPDVLAAAKRYVDVVSFNAYDVKPNHYREDIKALDCPVLISEYGFGASDLGRVSGYNPNIVTESDRVSIYQGYMAEASSWNNLVGAHWYKWEDDPASGRMWDGQVAALGLVSITDMPYPQLVTAVQQVNASLHQRLLTP